MSGTNGPYTAGTTISSAAINARFADDEAETTDSLSRSGKGGMLAVLRGVDGTVAAPAYSFTSEVGTGAYRAGASDYRISLAGADALTITAGTMTYTGRINLSLASNPVIQATATNAAISLVGNKAATDTGTDASISGTATRTAGDLLQVQNNGLLSNGGLGVDYHGLLRLGVQAAAIQPASIWTAITPNANWTALYGLAYWKDPNGIVHLKGAATWATGATFPMATLPAGFRPAGPRYFAINNSSTGAPVSAYVDTNGAISLTLTPTNGQVIFFDGVAFLAEA